MSNDVRARPAVLRDARDHVLFHLDPSADVRHAEDQSVHLTEKFIARARRKVLKDPWPQDAWMPLSARWKAELERATTPLSDLILRQHYGDGRSLDALSRSAQVDRTGLEGARGGLREVVRRIAVDDGLPLSAWPNARLDLLLKRLAALGPIDPCPPILEVIGGCHRVHVLHCPICQRAVRLFRGDVLSVEDLVAPSLEARPGQRVKVVAVQLAPEARQCRDAIATECGATWFPVGEDLLLLDGSDSESIERALVLAAEVGHPHRDQMRGLSLEGAGRWSQYGLLGPLAERASREVGAIPWGEVKPFGDLPSPLPEAPSARSAWAGAGVLALVAASTLILTLGARLGMTEGPLDAEFTTARGGVWTSFDTNDDHAVAVVRLEDRDLEIVVDGSERGEHARFAVGDGSFRLHTVGSGVLIVSSATNLPRLGDLMTESLGADQPLRALHDKIRVDYPTALVAMHAP